MLDLIHEYENYLINVKHASQNTVASYLRDIRQFSDWLAQIGVSGVVDASQVNICSYFSHLQEVGKSGATASRSLASLKNFYSYAVSSGAVATSPVP